MTPGKAPISVIARFSRNLTKSHIHRSSYRNFWDAPQERARAAKANLRDWLEMRNNYGDPADQLRFTDAFERCRKRSTPIAWRLH
jgi:hypothetical protein